jgi:hypothetical protein
MSTEEKVLPVEKPTIPDVGPPVQKPKKGTTVD